MDAVSGVKGQSAGTGRLTRMEERRLRIGGGRRICRRERIHTCPLWHAQARRRFLRSCIRVRTGIRICSRTWTSCQLAGIDRRLLRRIGRTGTRDRVPGVWGQIEGGDPDGLRGRKADALSALEERERGGVRDEAAGGEEEGDVDDALHVEDEVGEDRHAEGDVVPAEGVEARDRDGEQEDGVCDLRAWQTTSGQRSGLPYRSGGCLMETRTGYQTMRAATCIMVLSTISRRMANRHRSPCGTKRRVHFPLVRTRLPRTRRSTAVYSTNDRVAETNS